MNESYSKLSVQATRNDKIMQDDKRKPVHANPKISTQEKLREIGKSEGRTLCGMASYVLDQWAAALPKGGKRCGE